MILYLRKGVNYYMKKRNTAIRALSVFLAYAMVCTSVPAAGQEMFGSGVNRETEENTSDLKEFQSSQADEFGTDTESDAELFGSDDAKQEFQDGENSEEGTDGIRYIKGRPLTEEERKEELEPFKNLKPLDPGIEVESDLTSVYAAYGNREAAFPSSYDARKEGLVTPVKNQNPFGTCWAFGMAAIMETSLLAQNKGTGDQNWADAFTNVQVSKAGDNEWLPINTYYWEKNKEFRFAGYANGESQLNKSIVSYDAGSQSGGSTSGLLTFTAYSTDGKNDLVAAMGNESNYTWDGTASGEAPKVSMTFRHMLSKLTFTFKTKMANTYTVAVNNLRIESATTKSTGTYHKANEGTITWSTDQLSNTTGTYTFDNITDVTADAANEQGYFSQTCAPLFVIPQTCGTLSVQFTAVVKNAAQETIGQQDFSATLSYNPSNSETSLQKNTWTAGYYYNYTAELKMEDINTDPNAKPIKFDVTVDKWKDTTPGDDLNLTDKKN